MIGVLPAAWAAVVAWYKRPAAVWIELALWSCVLAVGVTASAPFVAVLGAAGLALRVVMALVVRVVIARAGVHDSTRSRDS